MLKDHFGYVSSDSEAARTNVYCIMAQLCSCVRPAHMLLGNTFVTPSGTHQDAIYTFLNTSCLEQASGRHNSVGELRDPDTVGEASHKMVQHKWREQNAVNSTDCLVTWRQYMQTEVVERNARKKRYGHWESSYGQLISH